MPSPVEHDQTLDQSELDRLVDERLEWAARLASAIAHDLGNLMLAMKILESTKPGQASEAEGSSEQPTQYLQCIIDGLRNWKRPATASGRRIPIREWWQQNGQLIRHFLPAGSRWSLLDHSAGAHVAADRLSMTVAALLLGIERQVKSVERVTMNVDKEPASPHVRVRIEFTPSPDALDLLIPSLVTQELSLNEHASRDPVVRIERGVEFLFPAEG